MKCCLSLLSCKINVVSFSVVVVLSSEILLLSSLCKVESVVDQILLINSEEKCLIVGLTLWFPGLVIVAVSATITNIDRNCCRNGNKYSFISSFY